MARKGENIFQRKDGRWEARYLKGHKLDGSYLYGYVYGKSYSEAKQKRNKILLNLKKEQKKVDRREFNHFIDSWLLYKKPNVKETTYSRYYYLVEEHIRPQLGKIKIDRINSNTIYEFINNKLEKGRIDGCKGLSKKTVKDIVTVLKQITKFSNIIVSFNVPKVNNKSITILSKDEQKSLENFIMTDINYYSLGILISLYTGIRIGELCALKWKDFDLKNNNLVISQKLIRVKNIDIESVSKTKIIVDEPKTIYSKRKIPLPFFLTEILTRMKSEDNNYILTNNKNYIEPRSYYNKYKNIVKQVDLEKYNFHCLRHTFATRCIELGFDPKTLSEILGHSDIKITLSLYVHPNEKMKTMYMEKLSLL